MIKKYSLIAITLILCAPQYLSATIQNDDNQKSTWLNAAKNGHSAILEKTYSENKQAINFSDKKGDTALQLLIIHWGLPHNNYIDCLNFLLKYQINLLNIPNKEGKYPIHTAAIHNNTKALSLILFQKKDEVNRKDDDYQWTPLMYGLSYTHSLRKKDSIKTIKFLLDRNADIYANTQNGFDIYYFASKYNFPDVKKLIYNQDLTLKKKWIKEPNNHHIHIDNKYLNDKKFRELAHYHYKNIAMIPDTTPEIEQQWLVALKHLEISKLPYLYNSFEKIINAVDKETGNRAIHIIILNWYKHKNNNLLCMDFLLKLPKTDTLDLLFSENYNGLNPMHLAAIYHNTAAINALATHKKNLINKTSTKTGWPPLMYAIHNLNNQNKKAALSAVKTFTEHNAYIWAKTKTEESPYSMATKKNWKEVLSLFDQIKTQRERTEIDIQDIQPTTPTKKINTLPNSFDPEQDDIKEQYIASTKKKENTPIPSEKNIQKWLENAQQGKIQDMQTQYNFFKDIILNSTNKTGSNALHYAASGNQEAAITFLMKKNEKLISQENKHNLSPLHLAATHQKRKAINQMLAFNPNYINQTNSQGNTILHSVSNHYEEISTDFLKYLISKGVNIHTTNNKNKTAYNLALENSYEKIARYLSDVNDKQNNINFPLDTTEKNPYSQPNPNSTDDRGAPRFFQMRESTTKDSIKPIIILLILIITIPGLIITNNYFSNIYLAKEITKNNPIKKTSYSIIPIPTSPNNTFPIWLFIIISLLALFLGLYLYKKK